MNAPNILTKHLNVDILSYIMVVGGNNIDMFGLIASCKYFRDLWHSAYVKNRTIRAINIIDNSHDCYATLLISPGNRLFVTFEGIYGMFSDWEMITCLNTFLYEEPHFNYGEICQFTIQKLRHCKRIIEMDYMMIMQTFVLFHIGKCKINSDAYENFQKLVENIRKF